jgi:hypothetical protein
MRTDLLLENIDIDSAGSTHGPAVQERYAAMLEARWALIISLLFYGVAMFGVFHHEMWRDEYQAWMIARSSNSFVELLSNLRYEGTGCLWHLCLYLISQFTDKPLSMQIFNVSIASCGAYIVARYAPFPRWQRALLVFGYFSLFEYGVISRCYALGNTLLFAACATWTQKHKWSSVVALGLLGLAANTSFFAALIVCALLAGMVLGTLWERASGERKSFRAEKGSINATNRNATAITAIVVLIFAALGIFALFQICPPVDGFRGDWNLWQKLFGHDPTLYRLLLSVACPLIGYVPLPDPRYGFMFRDTTIFGGFDTSWRAVCALLSAAIVAIFAASLWRSKPAFLAYVAGTASMIAFFLFVLLGSVRHDGQLFILLVCCLWISSLYQDSRKCDVSNGSAGQSRILGFCKKVSIPLFSAILVCQCGMAAFALFADYNHVFSPIVEVARYLKRKNREHDFIAVIPDWLGVGISGTLNRPVYELGAGRLSTFTTGGAKKDLSNHKQVLMECDRVLAREHLSEMLLVIDGPLCASNENLAVRRLKSFANDIVLYERMYLYSVKPRRSGQ